ncbi:MAG: hypothetical protein ACREEO_10140, partial [Phenylobacterium sp.]
VGLVHVRVRHGLHQLWPANPGGDIAGDGALIAWTENWELSREPFALRLQGWNLDDTFPHTVTVRIALLEARGPGAAPVEFPVIEPVLGVLELP